MPLYFPGGGNATPAPKATNAVSGTVKTDVINADPIVYLKSSVDDLLTGIGGAALIRRIVTINTGDLTSGQVANFEPELGKSYLWYSIESDFPSWVRVYHLASDRSIDNARPDTTELIDFNPLIKIVHEVFTTASKPLIYLSPIRPGSSYESPPNSIAPVAVKNMSGSTANLTISFNVLTLEN